jgi:predicted NUDIX family NTP pyrophosphohydrolase
MHRLIHVAFGQGGKDALAVPTRGAGILMYRRDRGMLEVLLVHPGGPFWTRKDLGAWSIPKGEHRTGESAWAAAVREFEEETGERPNGTPLDLGEVTQSSKKRITAFALAGSIDALHIKSGTFELEWPPRSGRTQSLPEVDRAEWFPIETARAKIVRGQRPFLDRLLERIGEHAD